MCRFALYLGPTIRVSSLVTDPSHSIIKQSIHSEQSLEPMNGDGFGIAWYVPEISPEPAVFKDITPAWNNPNLMDLARVTRSGCILAHVRAASPGLDVARRNCHPFSHGTFAFMHNGFLGGFQRLRRRLMMGLSDESFQMIGGTTDSELLFAMFLDRYQARDVADPMERLVAALTATITDAAEAAEQVGADRPALLNLAVTDGRRAAVSRYTSGDPAWANTLYVHSDHGYTCEGGRLTTREPEPGTRSALIASEPLTDDDDWLPIAPNHLVVVGEDLSVRDCTLAV